MCSMLLIFVFDRYFLFSVGFKCIISHNGQSQYVSYHTVTIKYQSQYVSYYSNIYQHYHVAISISCLDFIPIMISCNLCMSSILNIMYIIQPLNNYQSDTCVKSELFVKCKKDIHPSIIYSLV